MEQNTISLIIALAGIAATLISSAIGFYFTAKARTSPMRELLYSKQLDLLVKIINLQSRFKLYIILLKENHEFKERARKEITDCVKNYSELQEQSVALLPTELWVVIKQLNDRMANMVVKYDEKGKVETEEFDALVELDLKTALITRTLLGVDELSEESISLFSKKGTLQRLTQVDFKGFIKSRKDSALKKSE